MKYLWGVFVLAFIIASSTFSSLASAQGLALNFPFDEGSGTIAHDASGNGNDGNIFGASWTSGVSNYALDFDGVDDYIEVVDSESISALGSATLEAWIKPNSLESWVIIQKWGPGGSEDDEYSLQLESGRAKFVIQTTELVSFPASELRLGEWNYVAAVLDAGREMRIYLNGDLKSSSPTGASLDRNTQQNLYIGTSEFERGRFGGFVDGKVDEVSIWRRPLTSDEIRQRYEWIMGTTPNGFGAIRGLLLEGKLIDLFQSDDSYLIFRPWFVLSSQEAPIQVEIYGTSPAASPSELRFKLEAATNIPNINQKIELFNYQTQSYEEVDSRLATTSDSVVEITVSGGPSRFVRPGTLAMKAKISYKEAGGPILSYPWQARIDQAIWRIR